MTLLAPWGLLLGVLLPLLVLLYLLKVRRRDVEVSSTYIWRHLVRDLAAHEPFQRLKLTALLVAQFLLLAALVLAFARPAIPVLAQESEFAVVVVDDSASMQATDVPPSRFEAARARVRDLIQRLPGGSSFTLIQAARRPEVLASDQQSSQEALRAVEQLHPSNTHGDVEEALRLGIALAGDRPHRHLYVVTDGAHGGFQLPDLHGAPLSYLRVGGSSDNRAVTAIAARPDPRGSGQVHLFVRVRNYADTPVSDTLVLAADGSPVEARPLQLPANDGVDVVFDTLPRDTKVVQARLDGKDALPADDSAAVVLGNRPPVKVLLVSQGNLFLERLLRIIPGVDLYRADPRRYFALDTDSYDIVVFDNYLPESLPRGNTLILNPPASTLFPFQGPDVRQPRLTYWDKDHPLLHFVDLRDVGIASAHDLAPPSWMKPLVQAGNVPLLLAGDDGTRRVVLFPFDLRHSNLPLSVAFPILMSNIVSYLEPPGTLDVRSLAPDQPQTLIPLPQADALLVQRPDGSSVKLTPQRGQPLQYDQTDEIGLYTVTQRQGDQVLASEQFAVNLTDETESDIRPGDVPPGVDTTAQAGGPLVTMQREIWLPITLLACALLLFEWWLFHRRSG